MAMNASSYLDISIKLIATVVLLMLYVKISGKSQLAPLTAFDQIGNMVVGAIGGTTLLNPSVGALDSAVYLSIWILILITIRFLRARHEGFKNLIDGKRLQLMKNGHIVAENFEAANISISNVEILLHRDGLNGLYQAENIWYEPNGQITIDKKGDTAMSTILIDNGKILGQGLDELEKDEDWLLEILKKEGYRNAERIFCAEWVKDRLWVYPFNND